MTIYNKNNLKQSKRDRACLVTSCCFSRDREKLRKFEAWGWWTFLDMAYFLTISFD